MKKKTVAVVDDDLVLSKTLGLCLRRRGHEVRLFDTGVDAVKYFFEDKADSIVLDIRLPDCDGWFIARLLKKLEWAEKVPLIVLSVLEADRRKLAEVRPFAHIQKPFDMGQLMQTVEASLGSGRVGGV
ncbi:MAG: response regulator [Dehalococcoidia bacterium]|nr:response regulator [Dehalococcoidia bacterium]